MNRAVQIAVDLEQGEVRLGSERVRLLPVAGDVFCLNDARGPLVRALKFEERSLLLADSAEQDVASRVADAALVSSGVAPDAVRIAASLALAGGGEEAPPFAECERIVERQRGWDARRVGETMALVIDRLCSDMGQENGNGWKQIVFQTSETADLESLISRMVTNLSARAVASDSTAHADPQTTNKHTRHKSSSLQSLTADGFAPQHHAASHGSMPSASSVLPAKRAPFRVLAVDTDQPTHTEPAVVAASIPVRSSNSEIPQPTSRPMLTSPTLPPTPQKTDFPTPTNPAPNHVNFSLSEKSAPPKLEPSTGFQPVANFPTWQPFATSSAKTQAASEPAHTSSRAFGVNATESQTSSDWLAEVAQLLEAECDMRGIDP